MKSRRKTVSEPSPETRRCAIYTRKSTSVGLEQDFNSLDAQREACAAYIKKQPAWALVDERYDDGGFTGANIERPAFQRLLTDIDDEKDRRRGRLQGRSPQPLASRFREADGALQPAGASFVSVTQNFSTADAMGRLTLNMLMSFAEFEREMIGERTRDKIAAARRKGKWTGGPVPLGYTVKDKRLLVDEAEAVLVREIFTLYLEQRSALAVARILNERRLSSTEDEGAARETRPWTNADVLRLIRTPVYAGYVRSHGELYDGEHEAVVDRETFARAQALLEGVSRKANDPSRNPDYILRGLLRCACCGSAFTPASSRRGRTVYRYYRCLKRDKQGSQACPSSPLPADAIETYVIDRIREVAKEGAGMKKADTTWAGRCLADLDSVWNVLTPQNRGRLMRALVEGVDVDEPSNKVRVCLTDPTAHALPTQQVNA